MPNSVKRTFIQHILCILLKNFKPMGLYLLPSWCCCLIYLSAASVFQCQTYSHSLFYLSLFTSCLFLCGNYSHVPAVCREYRKGQESQSEWKELKWAVMDESGPVLPQCAAQRMLQKHVEFKCQNLHKATCAAPVSQMGSTCLQSQHSQVDGR